MFLKKKYRVTTRGKVVFSLIALLILYGTYMMAIRSSEPSVTSEPVVSKEVASEKEKGLENIGVDKIKETTEIAQTSPDETVNSGLVIGEDGESKETENCTSNKAVASEDALRLIEAAGFTIYYEPNAYYVPEGDIALIAEFVSVAKKYPEEQIVIEGNVNKLTGSEEEWDTEDVNQLGYTRGLVIKNDLIKRGIDKERIIIYNNKDEKPLHVDLSKKSIALNRRVDVFFSQFMYKEINTK